MLHSHKRLPRPQILQDDTKSADGFALIGALLLVLTVSIAVPQLLNILKDINKRGARDQAALNAAEFAKTIYSTTYTQLQSHSGLPLGWARWSGLSLDRQKNVTPCLRLLQNDDTALTTITDQWEKDEVRYSFLGHNDDNSTYSFGAIRFEKGSGAVANPFETYEIFGCYVRGQPLPAAGVVKGTYVYSGGRLRITDLTANNI